MHQFILFYAPFLVVIISIVIAFWWVAKEKDRY